MDRKWIENDVRSTGLPQTYHAFTTDLSRTKILIKHAGIIYIVYNTNVHREVSPNGIRVFISTDALSF